ncbi:MAG: hypothetical protein KAW56_07300, partial [Candidatus Marinimicrobia bacterium]|nr:hypothetical protein [Candidatus Neomarinimicrobiota bacterium]
MLKNVKEKIYHFIKCGNFIFFILFNCNTATLQNGRTLLHQMVLNPTPFEFVFLHEGPGFFIF